MKPIFKFFFCVTAAVLIFCSNCSAYPKIKIMASIYPIAEFCRAVAQDEADVFQLVPDGTEPHDFEPGPRDLALVGHMRLFVYNGVVESWAESVLSALSERSVMGVETAKGLTDLRGTEDPHVWISPQKAMEQVRTICKALCTVDKLNSAKYKANTAKYLAQLVELDGEYNKLGKLNRKTFVTSHSAFAHLAQDYGLTMISVTGLSPHAEPTPGDLQKIVQLVKDKDVRYVFFETLATSKLAHLLAQETGCRTAILDPAEGILKGGNLTYIDIQKRNIAALRAELE